MHEKWQAGEPPFAKKPPRPLAWVTFQTGKTGERRLESVSFTFILGVKRYHENFLRRHSMRPARSGGNHDRSRAAGFWHVDMPFLRNYGERNHKTCPAGTGSKLKASQDPAAAPAGPARHTGARRRSRQVKPKAGLAP